MGEQRAADARGQVAATASELRARGRRWAASWAVVRELGPAYYALVGLLAGLLHASGPRSQVGPGCEAFSSFLFFFVFFFYFLDLNSNLVFKFGFQIGAPYSLEF